MQQWADTIAMPVSPTRDFEDAIFSTGATLVIGMDEVGRGAIAGPVAVGACAITAESGPAPEKLRDSKLVTEKQRPILLPQLDVWAAGHAVGMASADEIERYGITNALRIAGHRALLQLLAELGRAGYSDDELRSAVILLDGSHNWLRGSIPGQQNGEVVSNPVVTRVKADRDCVSAAAASIYAKVSRDVLMERLHEENPLYGWDSNKGYGAPAHYTAIAEHGITPGIHRESWIKTGK